MSVINLAGHVFESYAPEGWSFSDLTDWLSVPDAKGGLSTRPMSHGSFDPGEWLRDSASPSFRAHFLGASSDAALVALVELRGVASSKSLVPMTVDLGDGPYTRQVRVQSIDVADTHGRSAVTVVVYLQAPDPLLYGPAIAGATGLPTPGVGISDPLTDPLEEGPPGNPGRVELTNIGTAETSVRFDVAGGLSGGVEIRTVETGQVLRLERLIPAGSTITMNSRTGRAVIDGQSDATGFLTVDQWSQVPPGATRTYQFEPLGEVSGNPTLSASLSPAYH